MADPFKICALCKNLEVLEQGREFEQIADTEYVKFRCKVLGWTSRDDYLMDPEPASGVGKDEPFDCPYWEAHPRPE